MSRRHRLVAPIAAPALAALIGIMPPGSTAHARSTAVALNCAASRGRKSGGTSSKGASPQGTSAKGASTKATASGAASRKGAASLSVDPKARALIDQMMAAYRNLSGYSVTTEVRSAGLPQGASRSEIQYRKPDRLAVRTTMGQDEVRAVTDGTSIYGYNSSDKTEYLKMAAQPDRRDNLVRTLILGQAVGVGVTPLLLTDGPALPPGLKSLKLGAPAVVDGTPVDIISGQAADSEGKIGRFTFAIGQADHLLRRITLSTSPTETVTETHSAVRANPELADASFRFEPPAGAKAIEPPDEPALYDPALKPGAKPFEFDATDLNGKKVSLDQYKGRVVLLDFWATWCRPCIMELPNVRAAYRRFKGQGFDILGVSLDQSQGQLESFLKTNEMPWRQVFDAAQSKPLADRYGVQGIPFELLIGRDGTIAAVNVRGPDLDSAIDQALVKK